MVTQDLLVSASKLASNKAELNALLQTWLKLGKKDKAEESYLKTLQQGIKLLEESQNLNQFRQKVQGLDGKAE
jgi:hypothetical protein